MEHQPPPFFKTGLTPHVRLLIFSALSLAFLVADARFNYLATLRQVASVIVYPFQRIAAAPAAIATRMGEFFVTHSSLRADKARLMEENFNNAAALSLMNGLKAENAHLRELLGARQRFAFPVTTAEVLYAARDPFSRKLIVDKGSQGDVRDGQAVVDDRGVVGQVTRVYPWLSEITLITDKGHLIPVQNLRNGLRAVLAGTGTDTELDLRFIPLNADFQNGDPLVTSGIDGVYPHGLPVAEVARVERNATQLFARITCTPSAGVANHTHVLIVGGRPDLPLPPTEEPKTPKTRKSRKG